MRRFQIPVRVGHLDDGGRVEWRTVTNKQAKRARQKANKLAKRERKANG